MLFFEGPRFTEHTLALRRKAPRITRTCYYLMVHLYITIFYWLSRCEYEKGKVVSGFLSPFHIQSWYLGSIMMLVCDGWGTSFLSILVLNHASVRISPGEGKGAKLLLPPRTLPYSTGMQVPGPVT